MELNNRNQLPTHHNEMLWNLRHCDPVVVGSTALILQGLSKKKAGDLDMAFREGKFAAACATIEELGGVITLDNPNSRGFDLRRQYFLDGEKYDFFIVGDNFLDVDLFQHENGLDYYRVCEPSIVWAARGYYAARDSKKYQDQLINAGFWTETRRPKPTLGTKVDKAVWKIKKVLRVHTIKRVLKLK